MAVGSEATGVALAFCRWHTGRWRRPRGWATRAAAKPVWSAPADWPAASRAHPLDIPDPAYGDIIKRRRVSWARPGQSSWENFVAAGRRLLRDAQIPSRLGKWLSEVTHAQRVAAETATVPGAGGAVA